MRGELFKLIEKYRKSPSEDSLNQLETKLMAAGVPHEQIKTLLADLTASLEINSIDEEALISEISGWQADANLKDCNLAVYRAIAPIAKLMYAVEQNGVAIEHAYKLAVLFDDEKKALAYLSGFIKSNPKVTQPLHDACLFSLPTGQFDLTIWRKLCSKYMSEPFFRDKVLPRADVLEDFIKSHQTGKKVDHAAIAKQRQIIEKINAERKKLKRKHGTLTDNEKEQLRSLSQQLIAAQKALVSLSPPFNHELHLTTLQAFLKIKNVESVGSLKYFLEHGLTEKDYAKFIALERKDDTSQIPNIIINGDEVGHPGFYLMKVDVMDDMQAARAACLGKLSNCCQSLSGEAGENCAIHGLTSPLGGFYVVCKGDVNNPLVSDPLQGQCWAWRSQSGAIVFDSIEVPKIVKDDFDSTKKVAKFYQALAVKLINNNHTNKIACGARSGISGNVGSKSVFNTKENFVDYVGYCDSSTQLIIADKARPYYGYEVDEQRKHETEKMIATFVQDEEVSPQSFEMLNWALLFNSSLATEIENVLQTEAQLEKLTMLQKMKTYLSDKWNEKIIQDLAEASKKSPLWTSIRNENETTPLMWAACNEYVDLVNILLTNHADVNANDSEGNTPLLQAACIGNLEVVNTLVANKADINARDNVGQTPLLLAVSVGDLAIVNTLLANRAEVNMEDNYGNTPLLWASSGGFHEIIIQSLLNHGADVNAKDKDGETPLIKAVVGGDLKLVNTLLANHADVNAKDKDGETPLIKAVVRGDLKLVNTLLANHADVNAKANNGNTPLLLAAMHGNRDVVNTLLANHADMNVKDKDGKTAIQLAEQYGRHMIAEILRAKMNELSQNQMNNSSVKPKPMAYSFQKENATHSSERDKQTDKPQSVVQQKPKI